MKSEKWFRIGKCANRIAYNLGATTCYSAAGTTLVEVGDRPI